MQVTVFSQPNCSPCKSVKNFLKIQGVPFKEADITEDAEAKDFIKSKGFLTTPVTYIGEQHVVGFNPANLNKALFEGGLI